MKQKSASFSVIHKDAVIDGNVSVQGKIVISGTIKGSLKANTVIISKEGRLFAKADAGKMIIAGKFEGELKARKELIILESGDCSGTVVCKNLVVEPGGILNASVTYDGSHEKVAVNGK